jgi:uncharacterized membrane protein
VTQVAFALHYAHDYYRPDPGSDAGCGLAFPGCTSIKSRALRRLVTLHSAVAFFFNTAVLALTVNVAASLAG